MTSLPTRVAGLALAATVFGTSNASASICGDLAASYQYGDPALILIYNDSPYAMSVNWADYGGGLTEYRLLQPDESVELETSVGHNWHLLGYTQEYTACMGPLAPDDLGACDVLVGYEDGGFSTTATNCDTGY